MSPVFGSGICYVPLSLVQASVMSPIFGSGNCYVPCTVSGVCCCPLYSILFHVFIVMSIVLCDVKGELVLHFSYFFDDGSMKCPYVSCFNTLKLGCLYADNTLTLAVAGLPVCGHVTWTQVTAGYRY